MTKISFNKFPYSLRYTALVHWLLLVLGSATRAPLMPAGGRLGNDEADIDGKRGERSKAMVASMVGSN
jgi:hypothetical protein